MSKRSAQGRVSSRVTSIGMVHKADTASLVTNGTENVAEDSFSGSYMTASKTGPAVIGILEPFYKPVTLKQVCETNNVLLQCIEAMEVNIDGTGHSIDLIEGATENEQEKKMLEDFFKEPYPMKTMVGIRRELRNDLESTGNGYLEVIRNAKDEVVLINYLDCVDTRLIRLDDPVVRDMTIQRSGKEVQVQVRVRERRFVQLVNGQKVYFREFGASRQINRETGEWETKERVVPFEKRGSEVLHFTVSKEARTPYGAPRWINQLPSALGSRKAEEFNLSYFDAGGIPPVLILVQGGYIGDQLKEDLQRHLNGGNKHRAAIVEAVSASGSLDSSGTVQIRVERFGSERQADAMFQQYDKNCEDHLRIGFRLPQMFIGRTTDVNFATAQVAYMVAEAQVFGPERFEFDSRINATVVRALGAKNYRFHSLPLTLTDVDHQLKAMEQIAQISGTDAEEFVKVLNKVVNLNVEYKKQDEPLISSAKVTPGASLDPSTAVQQGTANKVKTREGLTPGGAPKPMAPSKPSTAAATGKVIPMVKKSEESRIIELASQWAGVLGLNRSYNFTETDKLQIRKQISELSPDQLELFNDAMALTSLHTAFDKGLGELCGCATSLALTE